MDTVINMADAAHALDLARIRFQLMYELLPASHSTYFTIEHPD